MNEQQQIERLQNFIEYFSYDNVADKNLILTLLEEEIKESKNYNLNATDVKSYVIKGLNNYKKFNSCENETINNMINVINNY